MLAHSANFIKLTFVVASHKIFWWGCFAPLACCTWGNSPLFLPPLQVTLLTRSSPCRAPWSLSVQWLARPSA